MTLRELLVQFEIQNNLSHADVAKEVGVSVSTYYRWINGESTKLKKTTIQKLSTVLDCAHIYDGDLVYVKKCDTVQSGQIAIVMIEEEATIKKVYFKDDLMILEPANSKYESKFFTMKEVEETPVRIIGLVRFIRKDLA